MTFAQQHGAEALEWVRLHDRLDTDGVSFDWHEGGECPGLPAPVATRPHSLGLCLNVEGYGQVALAGRPGVPLKPRQGLAFLCGAADLRVTREAGQRHRFLIALFTSTFVRDHLQPFAGQVHPFMRGLLSGRPPAAAIADPVALGAHHVALVADLRRPPVAGAARVLWYRSKAVELLASFLFAPAADESLFCTRRRRVADERSARVVSLLRERLAEPLALDDLARAVGCSPHHLSRTFSETMGCTIAQYLRQVRLEKAAELLRSGRHNVTETALEVGYSSLSHFSQAFQEAHGCPPGSYPQAADKK